MIGYKTKEPPLTQKQMDLAIKTGERCKYCKEIFNWESPPHEDGFEYNPLLLRFRKNKVMWDELQRTIHKDIKDAMSDEDITKTRQLFRDLFKQELASQKINTDGKE